MAREDAGSTRTGPSGGHRLRPGAQPHERAYHGDSVAAGAQRVVWRPTGEAGKINHREWLTCGGGYGGYEWTSGPLCGARRLIMPRAALIEVLA